MCHGIIGTIVILVFFGVMGRIREKRNERRVDKIIEAIIEEKSQKGE